MSNKPIARATYRVQQRTDSHSQELKENEEEEGEAGRTETVHASISTGAFCPCRGSTIKCCAISKYVGFKRRHSGHSVKNFIVNSVHTTLRDNGK